MTKEEYYGKDLIRLQQMEDILHFNGKDGFYV